MPIVARAALSSYVALMGIWVLLGLGYEALAFSKPGHNMHLGGAICLLASLLWFFWLRGFRLFLNHDRIEYRDGLYRSFILALDDISDVKNSWVERSRLGRKLSLPRLLLVYAPRKHIAVNTKPFRRQDLQVIMQVLRERAKAN